MSIKNLATYLKNIEGAFQKIFLDELVRKNGGSMEAVVDGVSLLYYLYVNRTDTNYGGNFQHFTELCKQFCNNLTSIGIRMTVVFDGVPSDASDESSIKYCSIKSVSNSRSPIIPPLARNVLIHILREMKIPVVVTSKEAYRYILTMGKSANPETPVLTFGYDASLLIQDIDAYIYIDSISYIMDMKRDAYEPASYGEEGGSNGGASANNNSSGSASTLVHISAKISYPREIAKLVGLDGVVSKRVGETSVPISPLLILTHLLHADNSKIPEYMFATVFFQQQGASVGQADSATGQNPEEAGNNTNTNTTQQQQQQQGRFASITAALSKGQTQGSQGQGQLEQKESVACNRVVSIINIIKKYCTKTVVPEDNYKALLDELVDTEADYIIAKREEQRIKLEALKEEKERKEEEERKKMELEMEARTEAAAEPGTAEGEGNIDKKVESETHEPAQEGIKEDTKEEVKEAEVKDTEPADDELQQKQQQQQQLNQSPGSLYYSVMSKEEISAKIRESLETADTNYALIPSDEDQAKMLCDMIAEKNQDDPQYVAFATGTAGANSLSKPFISSVLRGSVPYEILQALVYRRILLVDAKPGIMDMKALSSGYATESSAMISRELRTYIYAQLLKGSSCNYIKEIIRGPMVLSNTPSAMFQSERNNSTAGVAGGADYVMEKVVIPQSIFSVVPGISNLKTTKPQARFAVLCKACGIKNKDSVNNLWKLAGSSVDPEEKENEYEYLIPHVMVISYLMSQKDKLFNKMMDKTAVKGKGTGSCPAGTAADFFCLDFVDGVNAILESITMPAKISTIKNEVSSNSVVKSSLSQFFFNEYLFAFNYLYILNTILHNPLRFGLKSFAISGVLFLHHKAEAGAGRGNLVRWRRRPSPKGAKGEAAAGEAKAAGQIDDGFQRVGKDEDRVFKVFRGVLETLTDMERAVYPHGPTRATLDAPRRNSNEQIRLLETRPTNQGVLKDGTRFAGPKGKGRGRK